MQPGRTSILDNIVVGIDFSSTGELALEQALLLGSERPSARVHVAYIAGPAGEDVELSLPEGRRFLSVKDAVKLLERHVEQTRVRAMSEGEPIESERVSVHIRVGDADEELLDLAEKLAAKLIVVGTHGRSGFRRLVLGSVAESVVRKAPCAVLVVRPKVGPDGEAE